jgi:hypothetical protein
VKVIAKSDVADLVRRRGGRLYVWADPHRCCTGAMTYLATSSEPPPDRTFAAHSADGFELYLDPGSASPPEELHLALKGWREERVEAYWNGCVFVI